MTIQEKYRPETRFNPIKTDIPNYQTYILFYQKPPQQAN